MTELRTGIIGCGKVAHLHAKAYSALKQSFFTAVCGREMEKTTRFAKEYQVKPYTSVREMVKRENLDVVSVCTPHPFHRNPVIEALKSGANVLVEKPLASSLSDCDNMLQAATSCGKKLGVVSQRRFYPACQRMKRAIMDGKLGSPLLGTVQMLGWRDEHYYAMDSWRGTWKEEGGGVLVNQAPHYLDILQWFMGEIDELFGVWKNLNHPCIEVDDTALAILTFKNGGIASLTVSNSQKPGLFGKIHVHGGSGASTGVQTDGGAMFIAGVSGILEPPLNDLWTIPGEEKMLGKWRSEDTGFFNRIDAREYFHQLQIEDFIEAVLTNRQPAITGEDGRVTVEIFTAIYRSARDKKPVKFPLMPETGRNDFDGRLKKK